MHRELTGAAQVVELGRYDIDTWYYSPYPEPFASEKKLYICEYTLKYFKKKKTLVRHLAKTPLRHPPGDEIYRSPESGSYPGDCATSPPIAVFEVGLPVPTQQDHVQSGCLKLATMPSL